MSKSRSRLAADWFAKLRTNPTTQVVEHTDVVDVSNDVAAISVTPADVSDQDNTSSGSFTLPAGNTTTRPSTAYEGGTRLNTETGSLEVYDGSSWNSVIRPFILSSSGSIYNGVAGDITITGQNFSGSVDIRFYNGSTWLATVTSVSVTSGSATVSVPSAVYSQAASTTITVVVVNSDGTVSNNEAYFTVGALPTGGSISTSGGYRYHVFQSSSNFVVPTGFSKTMDVLMVAGGGSGGGRHGGGGGGGGYLAGSTTIVPNTYPITIGGGGAGVNGTSVGGNNGGNTTGFGYTAYGGGAGGAYDSINGTNGGSGGGAGHTPTVAGSATQNSQGWMTGYGSAGANNPSGGNEASGGGGAGGSGASGQYEVVGGNGGAGRQWLDGYYYAGGGGGASWEQTGGNGGIGGGGGGNTAAAGSGGTGGGSCRIDNGDNGVSHPNNGVASYGGHGGTNSGGGSGGSGQANNESYVGYSGNGGSGIVVIRYPI